MYLYKTTIYYDTTNTVGLPSTNAVDLADFETASKQDEALEVSEITLSETTFVIEKSYEDFDALVDGTAIVWSDVKYIKDLKQYCISLLSNTQL